MPLGSARRRSAPGFNCRQLERPWVVQPARLTRQETNPPDVDNFSPVPIPRFAGEQLSFDPPGYLFFGDNLEVIRRHLPDESVDLVYLDPPFNSNRSYNLLFEYKDGTKTAGQLKAFDDTWTWTLQSARLYEEIVSGGGTTSAMLRGMREMIGTTDMLAYITMMTPRLLELRRVLKDTGSLFLHCDPTASHYLKIMLDAVFGPTNFRNEIVWHYYNKFQGNVKRFASDHDVIFWYSKTDEFQFSPVKEKRPEGTVRQLKRVWDKDTGRIVNAKGPDGKVMYQETDEKTADDVWRLPMLQPASREKLGYPTQKPVRLLERIIAATTGKGDVVLDPFCGCGTTIEAAQRLERRWIGVDITKVAIDVIVDRLRTHFPQVQYVMGGEPATHEEAVVLAQLDKHEFQRWALERLGISKPIKKGADRGIDGEIVGTYDDGRSWRAIVSVKGGGVNVNQLRDLHGTVTRERADIGIFLTLKPPTGPMKRDAAEAGFTKTGHPRLQILTVADLFDGKKPELPPKPTLRPGVRRLPLGKRRRVVGRRAAEQTA
jgi:site-specific DNA-methyltransferase (adenine-specific)